MLKRTRRTLAAAMALMMLTAQAAYADNVITADHPGEDTYTSQSGPGGQKEVGSNGYVIVGERSESGYVNAGPGAGGQQGTGTSGNQGGSIIIGGNTSGQNVTGPTGGAQAPQGNQGAPQGSNQITINQSIAKPEISSEAAVLYDATTNQIFFDKNANKPMYPASTTKLMTALLAAERLNMNDTVTFSAAATQNLESGAANVKLTTGDTLSVNDAMYALMLKSACEVANGLGEKVAGTQEAFAQLMTQRAKELGCKNTNFMNASGLNHASHYSTAYDMALIANAALNNETVRKVNQTLNYTLPASRNRGALKITNGHKMIDSSSSQYYAGIIGGKTGYTSKAGNTLATVVEKNGHRLIAVVMKSNQQHYNDTKKLLDYGYALIASAAGGNSSVGTGGNTSQAAAGWIKVSDTQWQYKKADGTLCKNEWLDLAGKTYWFDADTYMATGWRHFSNGAWYYFNPANGAMVTNKWVTENGKSYYLQSDGTMAVNTVINGVYQVDANGVYVKKLG